MQAKVYEDLFKFIELNAGREYHAPKKLPDPKQAAAMLDL